MSDQRKCIRVRIEGRVQGVWFRGWTVRNAGRAGLDGWVRNCADGSVEAVFSGPGDKVDTMIARCRRGPPAASVTAVHQTVCSDEITQGFHQR